MASRLLVGEVDVCADLLGWGMLLLRSSCTLLLLPLSSLLSCGDAFCDAWHVVSDGKSCWGRAFLPALTPRLTRGIISMVLWLPPFNGAGLWTPAADHHFPTPFIRRVFPSTKSSFELLQNPAG